MSAQIRHIQDVENILWTTQMAQRSHIPSSNEPIYSKEYDRGWREGFYWALAEMSQSFECEATSKKIRLRRDIQLTLRSIQRKLETADLLKDQPQVLDRRQGFNRGGEAALWCVATSFGVTLFAPHTFFSETFTSRYTNQWFLLEDILNILSALKVVAQTAATVSKNMAEPTSFYDGFEAGLQAIAHLFKVRLLLSSSPNLEDERASYHFWSQAEINHKLITAYSVIQKPTTHIQTEAQLIAYQQGFKEALRVIAISFGIKIDLTSLEDLPDL